MLNLLLIKLKKYISIYMSLCVCHTCTGAHGSRRRVSGPWSYSYRYMLWTAGCGCWESDLGPLGAQPSITRPLSRPFWDFSTCKNPHKVSQHRSTTRFYSRALEILMPQVWPRVKEFIFQMNFKEWLIQYGTHSEQSRTSQPSAVHSTVTL